MKYIIKGKNQLHGRIKISGNKNSVFPCVAASLLTDKQVILENIPRIRDVEVLIEMLQFLGVDIKWIDHVLQIRAGKIKNILPKELMKKLRGSLVLVGALLGRTGEADFYFPGGDVIGRRGIDVHLTGFEALGYSLRKKDLRFILKKSRKNGNVSFFQYIPSVTATENLLLASVLGDNTVILKNCATEPHVVDLCTMLNLMGAQISGIGSNQLVICGVKKLRGVKFAIDIDHMELGTYAVASAITGGTISIQASTKTDLDPIIIPLSRFGVVFKNDGLITVSNGSLKSVDKLITNIWPGFPTDMMSVAIVLATQSKGITLCHDPIFESRMFFVDKLISMGAQITIADPHRVIVSGPNKLMGRELDSPDIRAGMALVLAALCASGTSTINKAELIERGYEDVVEKLSNLGAKIEKVV